jgi:membrane protein HdeD
MKNVVLGLLAIILGLIVLAFPLAGLVAASVLTGFVVLMIAVWLLIVGGSQMEVSKTAGILNVILGIIVLIVGIGLIFSPALFAFLAGFLLYLAGFFLIIAGIIALVSRNEFKNATWAGVLGIILGILYIILGTLAFDPIYLGVLIGIWLIISGVLALFE